MNFIEHKLEQTANSNLTKMEDPHHKQLRLMFLSKYGYLLFSVYYVKDKLEDSWLYRKGLGMTTIIFNFP